MLGEIAEAGQRENWPVTAPHLRPARARATYALKPASPIAGAAPGA